VLDFEDEGPEQYTFIPAHYDAGEFKVGDRIRLTGEASETRHVGALGTIVRIDQKSPNPDGLDVSDDVIYPVSVWLDAFGRATGMEIEGGLGLPVCAMEIEKVED
jgi:hypothetical protein